MWVPYDYRRNRYLFIRLYMLSIYLSEKEPQNTGLFLRRKVISLVNFYTFDYDGGKSRETGNYYRRHNQHPHPLTTGKWKRF